MKTVDPMPQLREMFMDSRFASSISAVKTRGKPRVDIKHNRITFRLKKIIKGQTFLGIYPSSTNLPDAGELVIGDYALLQSGEVVQVM
jgi:hypothetical protein